MKKLLMMTIFCLISIAIISFADSSSILKEGGTYGEHMEHMGSDLKIELLTCFIQK